MNKPKFWQFKELRLWKRQMSLIATAQMLLQTPDLSYKSQIEIIGEAKRLFDLEILKREGANE